MYTYVYPHFHKDKKPCAKFIRLFLYITQRHNKQTSERTICMQCQRCWCCCCWVLLSLHNIQCICIYGYECNIWHVRDIYINVYDFVFLFLSFFHIFSVIHMSHVHFSSHKRTCIHFLSQNNLLNILVESEMCYSVVFVVVILVFGLILVYGLDDVLRSRLI